MAGGSDEKTRTMAATASVFRKILRSARTIGAIGIALVTSQPVKHILGRMTIGRDANTLLKSTDGFARTGTDLSIDRAAIITERAEALLQLLRFGERQALERAVPVAHQAAMAGNRVGKQSHGKRISVGIVIALEHEEVLRHQEGGSCATVRNLQLGIVGRPRETLAVGAHDADRLPLGKRHRTGGE